MRALESKMNIGTFKINKDIFSVDVKMKDLPIFLLTAIAKANPQEPPPIITPFSIFYSLLKKIDFIYFCLFKTHFISLLKSYYFKNKFNQYENAKVYFFLNFIFLGEWRC